MICKKCKAKIPDTAKFCPYCGAKIEKTERPLEDKKPTDVMICPTCKTRYPLGTKFCKKDGIPLQRISASEVFKPPPEVKEENKSEKTLESKVEITDEIKRKQAEPETEKLKEVTPAKTRKAPIWIVLSVFIIILAGVGGYLYFSGLIPSKQPKVREEVVAPFKPKASAPKSVVPVEKMPTIVNALEIERKLNIKLKNEGLNDVHAKVTKDLTATLKGTVNDPRDKMFALNITESFKELKGVKNEILVAKKPSFKPRRPAKAPVSTPRVISKIDPAKLEGDINRALRNAGLRGVTAEVNDNLGVTLKGAVGSKYEKDRAFEIARRFFKEAKRKKIRDIIFVVEQ